MNEFNKSILDLTDGERRLYDISIEGGSISQHIPIYRHIHETVVRPLYKTKNGESVNVKAFLRSTKLDFSKQIITDFDSIFGLNLKNGYNVYEVVSSGGIQTFCMVLSLTSNQPLIDLPLEMELQRIGESGDKLVFYLKDWQPSVFDISGLEAPDPNLNMMRNSLLEILPSLGRSNTDMHTVDSILSPYVGSDTLLHGVDGIGASYVGDILESLRKIHTCITEPGILPSISSFGVVNYLGGKTIMQIEDMRKQDSKFKVISWNMDSSQDLGNLKLSDMKYIIDALDVFRIKNLRNNIDFQQALILLTSRDKVISPLLFGNVRNIATKNINGWLSKGDENLINSILDTSRVGSMVARLASFHVAFQPDESKAIKEIENTMSLNIGDIATKIHEMGLIDNRGKSLKLERELDPRVITAFYSSDGSPESIAGAFISILGYTEKKANETLKQLMEQGLIYSRDGGKHYTWSRDSQLKFKI